MLVPPPAPIVLRCGIGDMAPGVSSWRMQVLRPTASVFNLN